MKIQFWSLDCVQQRIPVRTLLTQLLMITHQVQMDFRHATWIMMSTPLRHTTIPLLDITWLKDANLVFTESFDVPDIADGRMDCPTAQLYINSTNSGSFLGQTSWRLPTLTPVAGDNIDNNSFTNNATSDVGNGIAGIGWSDASGAPVSEMGHLYYSTLGNLGRYEPNGDGSATSFVEQNGWGVSNTGPFLNLPANPDELGSYWYGIVDVSMVFDVPPSW